MLEWFRARWQDFKDLAAALFDALVTLLTDVIVLLIEGVLLVVTLIVEAIPMPDFVTQYSLGNLLGNAGPEIAWIITAFRISEALVIIGAGYAFRLLRKLLTAGQW